ncbi:hypothetical protein [Xanthomonas theicola]|uniref:hypothetical protein n=1 Tax=Xanthomonas theicola TaxID=56464 RepID=UPI000FF8AE61|nr:hypothetical protein [Xanthomonas theicola]QNH26562.1 hypothetical protein G4Q83_20090 [Xanthomonas theicola]
MGGIKDGIKGVGGGGANILGGLAAGALIQTYVTPILATYMAGAGASAAAIGMASGAAVILAGFLGGQIGTLAYESGLTEKIGLNWLIQKAMDNGLGAFIQGLGELERVMNFESIRLS